MNALRPFAAAVILPLLFTGVVFLEAQRNRRGARAAIELTERELLLTVGSEQNSGAAAWINWMTEQPPGQRWLSDQQLIALGFDVSVAVRGPGADRFYARQLQRRGYVVLLLSDRPSRSRLVPVDAAPDKERLLADYPDGRTHLVTAATIGIRRTQFPGREPYLDGYLVNIDPRRIHIPTEFRDRLGDAGRRGRMFRLGLRYGSQLEPWVVDVR